MALVKADIKGSETLFSVIPEKSLFTEHMSPVSNLRYLRASNSTYQCLPMLSTQYCIDQPLPLSLENATVLFEKMQPFRSRVFYINRRAKFLKTKLDRGSYV